MIRFFKKFIIQFNEGPETSWNICLMASRRNRVEEITAHLSLDFGAVRIFL